MVELSGKSAGRKMPVWAVRSKTDLDNIWGEISNGTPKPEPDQKISQYTRPDGTLVQYRVNLFFRRRNDRHRRQDSRRQAVEDPPPQGRKLTVTLHHPAVEEALHQGLGDWVQLSVTEWVIETEPSSGAESPSP